MTENELRVMQSRAVTARVDSGRKKRIEVIEVIEVGVAGVSDGGRDSA